MGTGFIEKAAWRLLRKVSRGALELESFRTHGGES
jgi:hypothetical protein